ncbi:MAG: class III poly(R)-hydroxyalkanoic acid synthase subunit PhaE [Magnetococcales bacterium]|nr:class III poly(R)-hydroxyalkanoic acid synthase subunit PhaE [Magnetococcales bacterium]
MTEKSGLAADWLNSWADIQQKSWSAWSEMARKTMTGLPGQMPSQMPGQMPGQDDWLRFWQDNIERWNALFGGAKGGGWPSLDMSNLSNPLFAHSQNYNRFAEVFLKAFSGMGGGDRDPVQQWKDAVSQGIEQLRRLFTADASNYKWGNDEMWAIWQHPMQSWQSMFATPLTQLMQWSGLPLNAANAWGGQASSDFGVWERMTRSWMEKWLSTPPVGSTREVQEKWQQAGRYWLEVQSRQKEYNDILLRIGLLALEKLQQRLLNPAEGQQPVDSLRKLYQLWVDSGEEAYAQVVTTTEYQEANARWLNAMMRWRGHLQEMFDQTLAAMNLPNRGELNSSHQRVMELKRRVRQLEAKFDDLETGVRQRDQSREINALRDEMRHLRIDVVHDELTALKHEMAQMRTALTALAAGSDSEEESEASSTSGQVAPRKRRPAGKGEQP